MSGTVATLDARPSHRLVGLFPLPVFAFEREDRAEVGCLFDVEVQAGRTFASDRLGEFAAGRVCAHAALYAAGCEEPVVPSGSDRAPAWPNGFVGSITHTRGYYAAAAVDRFVYRSIGIDAETIERVTEDLWPTLLTSPEIAALTRRPGAARGREAAVVFSAKEAFYKCQSPLTQMWIDFHDVSVTLEYDGDRAGAFTVHPLSTSCVQRFAGIRLAGRFAFDGDLVLTGMGLTPSDWIS
jgi:4'-phosphopantetheinyl transferase EntD